VISLDSDRPPSQPPPGPAVVTETERAVENDYFSIKKHEKMIVDVKLHGDDEQADDPLYESISGSPRSVKSDATPSPDVTSEPYKQLYLPDICESSDL